MECTKTACGDYCPHGYWEDSRSGSACFPMFTQANCCRYVPGISKETKVGGTGIYATMMQVQAMSVQGNRSSSFLLQALALVGAGSLIYAAYHTCTKKGENAYLNVEMQTNDDAI